MWVLYALLAALSAAIVTILTKAGLKDTDSNLAFAVQSVFIIIVMWTIILVQGTAGKMAQFARKEWVLLGTAGIVTSLSSVFTFKALKLGEASLVTPLERTSILFAVIFAAIFLKERITWQVIVGGTLILAGTILIATVKQK